MSAKNARMSAKNAGTGSVHLELLGDVCDRQ
jgi:hypothetical protein